MSKVCCISVVGMAICTMTLGCTVQGDRLQSKEAMQMAAAEQQAATMAQRNAGGSQTEYRRELLNNQLRHAEMDLQSASTEDERRSLQERIDVIEHMIAALDEGR